MFVGEYQLELQLDAAAFIICYIGIVTNAALSYITGRRQRVTNLALHHRNAQTSQTTSGKNSNRI